MEINILSDDKESIEAEIPSLTIVEILRVYLNEDSNVSFVAWKRDHPTKSPILKVEGKNPKKSLKDAVSSILKDLDGVEKDFEKMK
jgi:DNA-directed RNA polymerase subunit L